VAPDASEIEVKEGDVVLLCSDDLPGLVPEDETLEVVTQSNGDLEKRVRK